MLRNMGLVAMSGIFLLAACGSRPPVPVADRSAPVMIETGPGGKAAAQDAAATPRDGYYIVKRGDTLRKIAQAHNLPWRDVADWNNMTDPSKIEVGQELRIAPPEGTAIVKPIEAPAPLIVTGDTGRLSQLVPPVAPATVGGGIKRDPKGGKLAYSETALAEAKAMEGGIRPVLAKPTDKPAEKPAEPAPKPSTDAAPVAEAVDWTWPTGGKLLGDFTEAAAGKESNKGIDIAGRMGEPVQAAAAGKVTYVGNLRGYGDFLVIRHNNDYISVYAHTSKILVKKDQSIAKGQKIAEIGSSDADQPKLHFEIRQQGKPIDPLKLLPAR
jgi:lipoprotein NlpD